MAVNEGTADCVDVLIDGVLRASKDVPKPGRGKVSSMVIFNRAVYKGWAENKEPRGKAKGKAVDMGPKRESQPKNCEMWVKSRDTSRDYTSHGEPHSAAGTIVVKCYQKIEEAVADQEGSQTQSQTQTPDPPAEDALTQDAPAQDAPAEDAPAQDAPAEHAPIQDASAADISTQDLQSAQVAQTPVAPTQAVAKADADRLGLFVEQDIPNFESCVDWQDAPGNTAFPDATQRPGARRDFAIEFANGADIRKYKENEKGRSVSQRVVDAFERKPGEYELYCVFVFHLRSLTTLKALGFKNLPEKWETRTPNGPNPLVKKPKAARLPPGSNWIYSTSQADQGKQVTI